MYQAHVQITPSIPPQFASVLSMPALKDAAVLDFWKSTGSSQQNPQYPN
jgi:hypothetical protein